MKRTRINQARLAKNLGSDAGGRVEAKSGYIGALTLAEDVRRRFTSPAGGGRARDRRWTAKRLMPVRPETLARLETLAKEVSHIVEHRVEPLQVAALLVERDLDALDDREVIDAIAAAARKRG